MATAKDEIIAQRGEFLAQSFLLDCGARLIESPDLAVDYLALFRENDESFQIAGVELETTERPLPDAITISAGLIARAARSNVPTLLLVIDVKLNKFAFAWLDEIARANGVPKRGKVRVPLLDGEQHRHEIRERVLSTAAVHA